MHQAEPLRAKPLSDGENRGRTKVFRVKDRLLLALSSQRTGRMSLLPLLPVLVGNCQGDRKGSPLLYTTGFTSKRV